MKELFLQKLIEVYGIKLNNGIWYEVHVDATEERKIERVFAESGDVTDEITDQLNLIIKNLDN